MEKVKPLAGVLLLALAIRAALFIGLRYNDEFEYSRQSHLLATGQFELGKTVYSQRIGLVGPGALFQKMFGVNNFSDTLWSELCSLGMVALAFLFATRAHSIRAGVIAGLLVAVMPLNISDASHDYSDLPAACFAGLSVWLLWRQTRGWGFVFAGAALGLSHLCKESSFFLVPLVLVYAWVRRDKRILLFLVGYAAILLAECALYGNPMGRYHAATSGHHRADIERVYSTPALVAHRTFLDLLLMWFWPLDMQFPLFGLIPAAFAVCLFRERRNLRFFAAWFGIVVILTNFWPLRVWPYLPGFVLYARVLESLVIPMAVVIGVSLARIEGWRRVASVAALAVTSLLLALFLRLYWHEPTRGLRGTHEVLLREKPRVVYCDLFTSYYLEHWNGHEPPYEIRLLETSASIEPGAWVVIHGRNTDLRTARDRQTLPELPPSSVVYREDRSDPIRALRGRLLRIDPKLTGERYSISVHRIP